MRPWRRRSCLILLLGIVGAIPVSGCAIIGPPMEQAALRRSIRKVGYTPAPGANRVLAAFHDLALAAGLDPAQIHIGFEATPHLRAASIGSHHFLVTVPVLESDDQCFVLGIAAHELAHDLLGHADRQVVASTGIGLLATAASVFFPGAGFLVQGAGWLGLRAYSRSQEADADARAAVLLESAGAPPWTLRYALEFLLEVYGDPGGAWDNHPDSAERLRTQPPVDPAHAEAVCGSAERRDGRIALLRNRLAGAAARPGR